MSKYNVGYTKSRTISLLSKDTTQSEVLHPGYYTLSTVQKKDHVDVILNKESDDYICLPPLMIEERLKDADKVYSTWRTQNKSLGAWLKGKSGSGKTVAIKYIATRAYGEGIPVIIVDSTTSLKHALPKLSTINQPYVLIVDEFDKMVDITDRDRISPFLVFLDGMSSNNVLTLLSADGGPYHGMRCRPSRIRYTLKFYGLDENEMGVILGKYKFSNELAKEIKKCHRILVRPSIDEYITLLNEVIAHPKQNILESARILGIRMAWYSLSPIEDTDDDLFFRWDLVKDGKPVYLQFKKDRIISGKVARDFVDEEHECLDIYELSNHETEVRKYLGIPSDMSETIYIDMNLNSRTSVTDTYADFSFRLSDGGDTFPLDNDLKIRIYF